MRNEGANLGRYIIKGGNPLVGDVSIGGAKNAALGVLAAATMADAPVSIENLPDVRDINVILEAIAGAGAVVDRLDRHSVRINGYSVQSTVVDNSYIRKMRASYYLLGAFLGKYKHAEVALPGGCAIGSRPIDQHLKGFEALGATTAVVEHGMIVVDAKRLVGARIYFDMVSVGATINVMMAAALAEGKTTLENVAKEPHVVDVANLLNLMGAKIKGAGTDVIRIEGVKSLRGATYSLIPDQIEAGTFMIAAAITKGDVILHNVIPRHMESLTSKLREIGCEISEFDDSIRVVAKKRLKHTQVKTQPYPGFPTDLQPQMTALLAISDGTSVVNENIFENRFLYVNELNRMGSSIQVEGGSTAIVRGVEEFFGASVNAPDLRAGAALVLAALSAKGVSTVEDIHYIQRGYEDFEQKLQNLGAVIELAESERDERRFQFRYG